MLSQVCNLHLDRSYTITDDWGVRRIDLWFSNFALEDLDAARKTLVKVVERYLRLINSHTTVRQELAVYPMEVEQLRIIITYNNFFGKYIDKEYTNQVRLENGCVTFYGFDAFDTKKMHWHSQKEPYTTTKILVDAMEDAKRPYCFREELRTGVRLREENPQRLYPFILR